MTDNNAPTLGDILEPCHPNQQTIDLLRARRSTAADFLGEPGPDRETLGTILAIGARVPDHRCVVPFRFILFEGDRRGAAGEVLADVLGRTDTEIDEKRLEKERARFTRAPIVVAVVSNVDPDHHTPEWEQIMTVGAVCQNLLIASNAHGFASQWLTEWYAFDDEVNAAFGLGEGERFAGFVYLGTANQPPKERKRPELSDLIQRY